MFKTLSEYTSNVASSYSIVIPKGTIVREVSIPNASPNKMYVVQCEKCLSQMTSHDRKYRYLTVSVDVVDTATKI